MALSIYVVLSCLANFSAVSILLCVEIPVSIPILPFTGFRAWVTNYIHINLRNADALQR